MFPKIGGFYPNMDGLKDGKPYEQISYDSTKRGEMITAGGLEGEDPEVP